VTIPGLEAAIARVLGHELAASAIDQASKYLELLVKWQNTTRLVGSSDVRWIVDNVILDSLLFAKVLPNDARRVLDLGSGAGVPGIPLAIALPHLDMTLVEARRRRASFLSHVIRELQLSRVRVVHNRLSETNIPHDLFGAFDAVVMRCAGDCDSVIPLALELITPAGVVIASGPPQETSPSEATWLSVAGVSPGSTRHFLRVSRTAPNEPRSGDTVSQ